MAYFTQAELEDFLTENGFADIPAADQAARLTSFQVRSQSIVDGKLSGKYETPFSSPPEYIKTLALHLAAKYSVFAYARSTRKDREMAQELWEFAVSELDLIATGKQALDIGEASAVRSRIKSNRAKVSNRHTVGTPDYPGTDDDFLFGIDHTQVDT
jgi:hypothetical protein